MNREAVSYTSVGDAQIAYQVVGDGPVDFVYMVGVGSNFQLWWNFPPMAAVLERMASFSRLILFDRRGSGISDALPPDNLPTWEEYADDLRAVLDACGSQHAAIFAAFDSGPVALTFGAVSPERVRGLILWNSFARFRRADDYEIGLPGEVADAMIASIEAVWGTRDLARYLLGSHGDDPAAVAWLTTVLRGACTPASYVRQNASLVSIDARPVLPHVPMPVLVFHTAGYQVVPLAMGRYIAETVPDGAFVELPENPMDIWMSNERSQILDRIEEFVTGASPASRADRVLASVLFTDIVDSTTRAADMGDARWKELLETHDRVARGVVERWQGCFVKSTGDGVLATFDGPGRGVMAALELRRALAGLGLVIRAGTHFGEIERRRDGDVGGVGVHIAARVMGLAASGEVACTRTVKELSLGSRVTFTNRGVHRLKGVPDEWAVFGVEPGEA